MCQEHGFPFSGSNRILNDCKERNGDGNGVDRATSFLRPLDHTKQTPQSVDFCEEGRARRRDGQTSIPTEEFEPAIPASEQLQTLALHRLAIGMCNCRFLQYVIFLNRI